MVVRHDPHFLPQAICAVLFCSIIVHNTLDLCKYVLIELFFSEIISHNLAFSLLIAGGLNWMTFK